jgi:hypothetical protein
MCSNIKFNFGGILNENIKENYFTDILKTFALKYFSYLFRSEPQVSYQIDNGDVIPVPSNDTKISVKSLISKDEDGLVDIIAQKEWQLAYPDTEYVKCITDGSFVGQYRIEKNNLELKK